MTDAGTTQDYFILPAPPVGGLPISQDWLDRMKLVHSVKPVQKRERNVLFNDTLNTFYLWLYGVRRMVKDHSDSEKGNPLPPHRLLLSINGKGSFICTNPDRITHTTAFVTPVVEHWLEREIFLKEAWLLMDVQYW